MMRARVAVYSPWCATGGVEALHQLAAALQDAGHELELRYYEPNWSGGIRPEYQHYGLTCGPGHLSGDFEWAIIPEIARELIAPLRSNGKRVAFWHLGVGSWPLDAPDVHLACGTHAIAWCRSHGIEPMAVSDYIGRDFHQLPWFYSPARGDVILHGWRSSDKIDAIREHAPELQFRELRGLSSAEMAQAMCAAKVVLEAGGSGGRDRTPREAVLCGAAVVWYKSDPQFDVPLEDRTETFAACAARLRQVLAAPKVQDLYREWILNAESRFRQEVAAFAERYLGGAL